jgi:hypothetical protein
VAWWLSGALRSTLNWQILIIDVDEHIDSWMTKQQRNVWFVVIVALLVCAAGWTMRDLYLSSGRTLDCGDGSRRTIDLRDFVNRYSGWSVTFEAEVQGKGKIGAKLDPVQVQQLSEAAQRAAEFRKYVVAGYNACAINKDQYARFGARFEALDALERQIAQATAKEPLTEADRGQVQELVKEFVEVSRNLR